MPGELVDLAAVGVDLPRDQERLETRRLRRGLGQRRVVLDRQGRLAALLALGVLEFLDAEMQ